MRIQYLTFTILLLLCPCPALFAQQLEPTTPPEWRSRIDFERQGTHDANRIRTIFYNYGMVGDFQVNPDLSVFHSAEVPRGTGLNYSDGITPFVLARITQANGREAYMMQTGYRERQASSPFSGRVMRYEPRPGYAEPSPNINRGRSIALSNDPRTWPGAMDESGMPRDGNDPANCWYDKRNVADDPGWCGSWNGFFGKRPNADQESFFVMDDNFYDAWNFFPDSRDSTRNGLGLRVEVRGFQWANPQAQNVIFWHYDIVNEGTTTYEDIIFGLYNDSGVGGSAISCDGTPESDDDNAFYNTDFGLDLVYTWDKNGRGVSLSSNCASTGYLGYAYLETPGNPFDGIDNDEDGILDEMRDGGVGQRIEGQDAIRNYFQSNYDVALFQSFYGPLEERPAFVAGVWWTGDEDMDWVAEFSDTGADGIFENDDNEADTGELDGIPTFGEPNFDRTDVNESDMIGLTGFKMNRIRAGAGAPSSETDNVVFFMNQLEWPLRLYNQFTDPDPDVRFDEPLVLNYNIGFLFASGPFRLEPGRRERFSLALAYGDDLTELESNVETVQSIYNANYQFATPPPLPTVRATAGDGFVRLSWDNAAERSVDPVTNRNDFEGYRVYRSTDPNFLDAQVISNARGTGPFGNGRPIAQYDLKNGISGYSDLAVEGVSYWLGEESGITHTFTDSTVVNGQNYYYAVTSYDRGSEEFNFFPSENAITISRTLRGGTILPQNAVQVRPNPPVPGYIGASVDQAAITQITGRGSGQVNVNVINSDLVPDNERFRIEFVGEADSIRASGYNLINESAGDVLYEQGSDLGGEGTGPIGEGLLVVIDTPPTVEVDSLETGFSAGSVANGIFSVQYVNALSINLRRPGYPENLTIRFSDTPLDTSLATIGAPAKPARFRITSDESGMVYNFRFRDVDDDGVLNAAGEFIEVLAPQSEGATRESPIWRFELDTDFSPVNPVGAGEGDEYLLRLKKPYGRGDSFTFVTAGERVDEAQAEESFKEEDPYVVPNPYVASASFEPERFAVAGRGVRRLEFRAIPANAAVRIYSLRGELVQTLFHDGSTTGIVAWDLRSKDNLEVAPGLYIFHVDAEGLGEFVGKFAIIK
ncbi:MAG: hypothetical protein KTR29_18765 [Rhodothermaceae bacterium]|nr:hypothetical protein [Rhodothermaceae bacterium]